MNVLIACEFSGRVREAFRERGHNAWSIGLEPTEIPGQHIQGDCLEYLEGMWEFDCGGYAPLTVDARLHNCQNGRLCFFRKIKWDIIIAFPPCTYLSSVGNRWMKNNPQRQQKREEAFEFFMKIINAPAPKICVENPLGYANSHYRKPDQIVHPYYFGDPELKRTCFWLKGLLPLTHPDPKTLRKPEPKYRIGDSIGPLLPGMEHLKRKCHGKRVHFTESKGGYSKLRSRTFNAKEKNMLTGKKQKLKCKWQGRIVYQLRCDEPGCGEWTVAGPDKQEIIAIHPDWLILPNRRAYCPECRRLEKHQI